MAQKRKTHQSKLENAAALLKKIEEKTIHSVKSHLTDNWRDNLFEILMTRLELAAKDKKTYCTIPDVLKNEPKALPRFSKMFLKTMRGILTLAKAPASPLHVAAFSILYISVVKTFIDDETKDHAKTMAAIDKRLAWFEQAVGYIPCP